MMRWKWMQSAAAALLAAGILITDAASPTTENWRQTATAETLAESLTYAGVDVSSSLALERCGVVFRDRAGNPADLFQTLADAGINTVRVRVWNDPTSAATGESYGGGACDLQCAVEIARRCQAAGLKLLVDFHYSDFWADPGKQTAPKAWAGMHITEKAAAITQFTSDALHAIGETGVEIAMVQVGNETTTGMCGVMLADYDWSQEGWADLTSLWNAGAHAVRAYDPNIQIALHFTNPERSGNYAYIASQLAQYQVDYDVFATSYYPYWHGTLSNLTAVLGDIATQYHKQVMVAETSWCYTFEDSDHFANTISSTDALGDYVNYPISVEGQIAFLTDLFHAVASVPNGMGIGVFYWEPAWLSVGNDYAQNLVLWEQHGAGWASQASQEYDPDGKYYGGSAVDNQALFDATGKPLDSLYVFQQITGAGGSITPSANLLANPSFEADGSWTDSPKGWQLFSTAADGHFDIRAEDVRTGDYALHWYTETGFQNSTLSTDVTVPEDGLYTISVRMQGNAESAYIITARSREDVDTYSGNGSGWANWNTAQLCVQAHAGERLSLVITVSAEKGGYGSIDDCAILRTGELPGSTTTVTTETTRTPPVPMLRGDVDCDGAVGLADAILLARYAAEDAQVKLSGAGIRNGDWNEDGILDATDVTAVLRVLAKL